MSRSSRGEQDSSKHVIRKIIIHSPHGRTCCTLSLSSADERFTSWESARFRGVKNWTMRRIAFSFLVFRRHFADGDTANSSFFVNRKNFVHKLATRRRKSVNAHDCMLLMYCELLVGARGFEPPTSRSRMIGAAKT